MDDLARLMMVSMMGPTLPASCEMIMAAACAPSLPAIARRKAIADQLTMHQAAAMAREMERSPEPWVSQVGRQRRHALGDYEAPRRQDQGEIRLSDPASQACADAGETGSRRS